MEYLVGLEHPYSFNVPNIKVSDDTGGFGPGLLASYPLEPVEAFTPQLAGYRYAVQYGLTHILIVINLQDNSDEWWMEEDQVHKIATETAPIWEAE